MFFVKHTIQILIEPTGLIFSLYTAGKFGPIGLLVVFIMGLCLLNLRIFCPVKTAWLTILEVNYSGLARSAIVTSTEAIKSFGSQYYLQEYDLMYQ